MILVENSERCADSFNIDVFMDKEYDFVNYNCAHFAVEIWQCMTGQIIDAQLCGLNGLRKTFILLKNPLSPCIVLMQNKNGENHIGVFIRDKVLHLRENGVCFESIYLIGLKFKRINYYDVK